MPLRSTDRLTLAYALVLGAAAALYRLAPYYLFDGPAAGALWNLMPVGAVALFAGSRLRAAYAYLLPVGVMLLSDLLLIAPLQRLGWPAFGWGRLVVYASFLGYVLLGRVVGPRSASPLAIGGTALLGGAQFFLITNFAVWPNNPMYAQDLSGLLACYVAGLPFYRNTLLADLACSGLFFVGHAALLHLAAARHKEQPA